eukprot:1512778-Pleurochrysis_carterae.AAC.3
MNNPRMANTEIGETSSRTQSPHELRSEMPKKLSRGGRAVALLYRVWQLENEGRSAREQEGKYVGGREDTGTEGRGEGEHRAKFRKGPSSIQRGRKIGGGASRLQVVFESELSHAIACALRPASRVMDAILSRHACSKRWLQKT